MTLRKIIDSGYQVHVRQNDSGNMVFHAYPQNSLATKHIWMECDQYHTPEHVLSVLALHVCELPATPVQEDLCLTG